MNKLTVEYIKEQNWLLFEAIVGSKAYGLNTEQSDTDIRGIFLLPKEQFYGLGYVRQVNNESNDIVYYELGRFVELLLKNNPNILELLSLPEHCILYKHPVMNLFSSELFLSKLCEETFANYAFTQIKKAAGLDKKIWNPVEEVRKTVLDFCYVYTGKASLSAKTFLVQNGLDNTDIGLASVSHLQHAYNMYVSKGGSYRGIVRAESNEVCLPTIAKDEEPVALLYFNKDGYSTYCKQYKEYWDWVHKRNETRYQHTLSNGKNYDAKNMLHVFRLLHMAKEIAQEQRVNVLRKDRSFLLDIKAGKFDYAYLVNQATALKNELPDLYAKSNLPPKPDADKALAILVHIRNTLYTASQ